MAATESDQRRFADYIWQAEYELNELRNSDLDSMRAIQEDHLQKLLFWTTCIHEMLFPGVQPHRDGMLKQLIKEMRTEYECLYCYIAHCSSRCIHVPRVVVDTTNWKMTQASNRDV